MKLRKQLWATLAVVLLGSLGFTVATVSPAQAKQMFIQTLGLESSNYSPATIDAAEAALVPRGCIDRGFHQWAHLGGDPVKPNVETRVAVRNELRSRAGRTALRCNGLTPAEIKAVLANWRQFTPCRMTQGQMFKSMTFSRSGNKVDHPTVFVDPRFPNGAPAWCLTIRTAQWTTTLLIPVNCGNVAIVSRTRNKPKPPATTPTVTVTVTTNTTTTTTPSTTTTTPSTTTRPTTTTTTPTTTTTANRPPQVEITNTPAHVCVNGQFVFRANFSDPDGDNLQVSWSASGGTISGGRESATFTAQGSPGTGSVTVTVSDGKESRSASSSFPIAAEENPPTPTSC